MIWSDSQVPVCQPDTPSFCIQSSVLVLGICNTGNSRLTWPIGSLLNVYMYVHVSHTSILTLVLIDGDWLEGTQKMPSSPFYPFWARLRIAYII